MSKYLLALSCILLIPWNPGLSQPAASPVVASPHPGMNWRVDYRSSKDEAGHTNGPSVRYEENTVDHDLRKETRHFHNASPLTRYVRGHLLIYQDPETREVVIEPADGFAYGGNLSATGFPEFSWISPKWHRGTREVNGILCDVYRHPWPINLPTEELVPPTTAELPFRSANSTSAKPHSQTEIIALIAKDTRLPVSLEDPIEKRHYTFSRASSSIQLPAELAQALADYETAVARRKQRYNIPQ